MNDTSVCVFNSSLFLFFSYIYILLSISFLFFPFVYVLYIFYIVLKPIATANSIYSDHQTVRLLRRWLLYMSPNSFLFFLLLLLHSFLAPAFLCLFLCALYFLFLLVLFVVFQSIARFSRHRGGAIPHTLSGEDWFPLSLSYRFALSSNSFSLCDSFASLLSYR